METIRDFFSVLYQLVWSPVLLLLVLALCFYLSFVLKGLQFRYLFYALKLAFKREKKSTTTNTADLTLFQALMTSLAATIGIGNIVGVALMVRYAGLGALFWLWLTVAAGMAIKYSETALAIKYRVRCSVYGELSGGPMYYLDQGLGSKKLASFFAFFGILASFCGGNMIQANSIAAMNEQVFALDPYISAILISVFIGFTVVGGVKSVGRAASILVPVMAFLYLSGALLILFKHMDQVLALFGRIFSEAFSFPAMGGGFFSSSFFIAMQMGITRGTVSNEVGMGTASIAAAAAKSDSPSKQALVMMVGSFVATVVISTATVLVLAVTGVLSSAVAGTCKYPTACLTLAAFEQELPYGAVFIAFATVLFAYTTILGWSYYGEKCAEYLFGKRSFIYFRLIFTLLIIPGAVLDLALVWNLADSFNGLMMYPNLIGLFLLAKVVKKERKKFLMELS